MAEFRPPSTRYAQCVDWIFAQMDDPGSRPASGPLPPPLPPLRAPAAPEGSHRPPPSFEGADDVRAAQEWFQAERQRLEDYTQQQFALIEQQHYQVLAKHYQVEADIARRVQEVNREIQLLSAQGEAMKERARGLAEWEAALAEQTEWLARLQYDLAAAHPGEIAERDRLAALEALRAAAS